MNLISNFIHSNRSGLSEGIEESTEKLETDSCRHLNFHIPSVQVVGCDTVICCIFLFVIFVIPNRQFE